MGQKISIVSALLVLVAVVGCQLETPQSAVFSTELQSSASNRTSVSITNPGFEQSNWAGWQQNGAYWSSTKHSGSRSAKVDRPADYVKQTVSGLSPNTQYVLRAWIRADSGGTGVLGVRNHGGSETTTTSYSSSWTQRSVTFTTGPGSTSAEIFAEVTSGTNGPDVAFDDFTLETQGSGSGGLDPNAPPSDNFDLSRWKLTIPNGGSDISETQLNNGYEAAGNFFTDPVTGGMVFRVPNIAGTTSGSSYARTELREMLRAGDTSISTRGLNANNWVFSNSSASSQSQAGGVDGTMTATLRVDRVSTTGTSSKRGRVIIGQIHASDNEPIRLYYRKLPGNSNGSIYFAVDPNIGPERWYEMIGSRSSSASNPSDGIALGEQFSYSIQVVGNTMTVRIIRPGRADVVETVSFASDGFADDWMYFKAGAYNQNNTGDSSDYAQATFFALDVTHP